VSLLHLGHIRDGGFLGLKMRDDGGIDLFREEQGIWRRNIINSYLWSAK
jgi:hypothetical protein